MSAKLVFYFNKNGKLTEYKTVDYAKAPWSLKFQFIEKLNMARHEVEPDYQPQLHEVTFIKVWSSDELVEGGTHIYIANLTEEIDKVIKSKVTDI